jgi:cation transport ATPase
MNAHESAQETEEFAEYLSENSQCYRIDEADFVGGYFAKKKHAPKMYKKLRITLPIAFAAAIAAAALSAVFGEADVYRCLVNASVTFMMCAPAAVFFANELPMYLSSLNAYSNNSAILGDSAPEMMENMATVSFTDKDVFQNDGVRIKGVKVIGNNRIDHIIYYATSVFDIVGGPLAKVFKQASLENSEPESAEVRVISDKGIDAMVDGKHIVMGVHQFMDAQCFNPVREAGDEQWEGKTNKRILYLACNEELIAKFYVEYNVNPEFVFLVKKLAKAGVCIGVRTNDPCVDIDIFYRNKLSPEQYPLRVVKGADMPTDNGVVSAKPH